MPHTMSLRTAAVSKYRTLLRTCRSVRGAARIKESAPLGRGKRRAWNCVCRSLTGTSRHSAWRTRLCVSSSTAMRLWRTHPRSRRGCARPTKQTSLFGPTSCRYAPTRPLFRLIQPPGSLGVLWLGVQAHLNDAGNYAIRIEPQHAGASSQVRGSIHIESAGDRAAGDPTASTQKEAGCCSDDHHDHHHHDDHTASQRRA